MTDNYEWLQRVVVKLNKLHLNGFDFQDVYRWVFDWDDKLSSKENLENVRDEDRALTTLKQAGVIHGISKDNFYREQQEWQLADKGFGMWSDWDTTDPAHREYDYIWFVDGFDYDRFQKFCDTHGFNPAATKTKPLKNFKPEAIDAAPTPLPNTVTPHPLKPIHYTDSKGVLALSPTVSVAIVANGKIKRPDGEKYMQCVVMEKLFKSVNSLKRGVFFRTVLSVNDPKITPKMEKKIRNAVDEINKKVAAVGGPENLVKVQNKKVFVNGSYLE
jgi:hypothetical protein